MRRAAPASLAALGLWSRCLVLGVGGKSALGRATAALASCGITNAHIVRLDAQAWPTSEAERKPLDDMLLRTASVIVVDEGAPSGDESFLNAVARHVIAAQRRTACVADGAGAHALRSEMPADAVARLPISPPQSSAAKASKSLQHPLSLWLGPPDLAYSALPTDALERLAQSFGAVPTHPSSANDTAVPPGASTSHRLLPPPASADLFALPGLTELHLTSSSRGPGIATDAHAAACEALACHCALHCKSLTVLRVDTIADARSALRLADAAVTGGMLEKLGIAGGPLMPVRALLRGELAAVELGAALAPSTLTPVGRAPPLSCAPLGTAGAAALLRLLNAAPRGALASIGWANAAIGAAPPQPPHLRAPDAPLVSADVHALARHLLEEQSSLAHGFGVALDAWTRPASGGAVLAPPDGIRLGGAPMGAAGAAMLSQLLLSVRPGLDVGLLDVSNAGLDAAGMHDVCAAADAAEVALTASPSRLALSGNDVGDSKGAEAPASAAAAASASAAAAALCSIGKLAARALCEHLELRSCGIGKRGVGELARGLRGCRALIALDLSGNPSVGDDGAKTLCTSLSRVPKLTHLMMAGCGLGDMGAANVARLLGNLVRLDISGNPSVGAEGIRALGAALGAGEKAEPNAEKAPLAFLDVSRCSLGRDGARHLAALIALVPTRVALRELRAAGCKLHGDGVAKHVAPALRRAWGTPSGLVVLDLRRNGFGDAGSEAVAAALGSAKSLTSLDVRGNALGDAGARALLEAVRGGGAPRLSELRAADGVSGDAAAAAQAAEELVARGGRNV